MIRTYRGFQKETCPPHFSARYRIHQVAKGAAGGALLASGVTSMSNLISSPIQIGEPLHGMGDSVNMSLLLSTLGGPIGGGARLLWKPYSETPPPKEPSLQVDTPMERIEKLQLQIEQEKRQLEVLQAKMNTLLSNGSLTLQVGKVPLSDILKGLFLEKPLESHHTLSSRIKTNPMIQKHYDALGEMPPHKEIANKEMTKDLKDKLKSQSESLGMIQRIQRYWNNRKKEKTFVEQLRQGLWHLERLGFAEGQKDRTGKYGYTVLTPLGIVTRNHLLRAPLTPSKTSQ